ncbi:unnamed protein product [Angiostrongylus costaricensis]|uniref:DUF4174 domain-containing protein n=1 Tax=Angiostrongylus costaricensis TaxID=334426 RepID=A0A0R3PJU1_ANGCS|nr:unnamed protein product [Angiostrongylus costaricensis]
MLLFTFMVHMEREKLRQPEKNEKDDSSKNFVDDIQQADWSVVADNAAVTLVDKQRGLAGLLLSRDLAFRQILSCPDVLLFDFSPTKLHVGFRKVEPVARRIYPSLLYMMEGGFGYRRDPSFIRE